MVVQTAENLALLYEADETAWLEAMAELIRQGRQEELDYANLREYLSDMAIRDRREVKSRLRVLLAHLLKWMHQPEKRAGSWRATILEQQDELEDQVQSSVLRNHAEAVMADAYRKALLRAWAETGIGEKTFPAECPWTLNQLLSADVLE